MTANEYLRNVKAQNLRQVSGRLWQRNFYEHILHSEESLNRVREYIIANPLQWQLDLENPLVQADFKKQKNVQKIENDLWEELIKTKS